ncbi:hypothetical protein BU17DRAFT_63489 [Hysterangium stoloniferum]|nr:hypothetical protein BU17DRAFT_63489 [Hysterangium stoloniferum]
MVHPASLEYELVALPHQGFPAGNYIVVKIAWRIWGLLVFSDMSSMINGTAYQKVEHSIRYHLILNLSNPEYVRNCLMKYIFTASTGSKVTILRLIAKITDIKPFFQGLDTVNDNVVEGQGDVIHILLLFSGSQLIHLPGALQVWVNELSMQWSEKDQLEMMLSAASHHHLDTMLRSLFSACSPWRDLHCNFESVAGRIMGIDQNLVKNITCKGSVAHQAVIVWFCVIVVSITMRCGSVAHAWLYMSKCHLKYASVLNG